MLNKPSETSYLPATLSTPKPGDFSIGSVESKAAARMLAGKRKAALIPVMCIQINNVAVIDVGDEHGITNVGGAGDNPPSIYVELNPTSMGNTPVCWMTRQELETKQREYDEHEKRCAIERDASRPGENEVREPVAFDEKKPGPISPTAAAAPQQTDLESSEEQSAERWAQFVGSRRRRPLVRKPPYRRHQWPPSAYGL